MWSSANLVAHIKTFIQGLSDSDGKALYHTLSTLSGHDSWLDVEAGALTWALRMGPRGLAVGWEEGRTLAEMLYRAEQEDLVAHWEDQGCRDALAGLAKEFRARGMDVRKYIGGEECV
jgi:hypothetical protein